MGAFLSALFGPLLTLIEFVVSCLPHLLVVRRNEVGVKYPGGGDPVELSPEHWACPRWLAATLLCRWIPLPAFLRRLALVQGVHWYLPVVDHVQKHHTCAQVLDVPPITIETADAKPVAAGMVIVYRIVDVLTFEVLYYDADSSLAELGEGALRKLVLKSELEELRNHRQPLDDRLASACRRVFEDVGVEVLEARLTEQAQLDRVSKVFGVEIDTSVSLTPSE